MEIPKRFKLMGHTIEVKFDPELQFRENCAGEARYRTKEILLAQSTEHHPRFQSDIEQTFYHELMHWIFHELNETELRDNEKLVDTVAALLQQAHATMEYDSGS